MTLSKNRRPGPKPQLRSETAVYIQKSDRVVALGVQGGGLSLSLYKCVNAVMLALQSHVNEKYESLSNLEQELGETILELKLPFPRFCEYMGWKSTNKKKAYEVIDLLELLKIRWDVRTNLIDDELEGLDVGFERFVNGARIKDGELTLKISPNIRRELINAERYPEVNVDLLIANNAWTDRYTATLYEMCLENIRDSVYEFSLSINDLRARFNITYEINDGKVEYAYPMFKEFNRNVIKKAVNNLNATSILDFEVNETAVGKPVKKVIFKIKRKVVRDNESRLELTTRSRVEDKLNRLGLTNTVISFFEADEVSNITELDTFQIFYVDYCIKSFEKQLETKQIKSITTYFTTILTNNVSSFEPEWKAIDEKISLARRQISIEYQTKKEDLLNEVRKQYRVELANNYLSNLSADEIDDLFAEAVKAQRAKNPIFQSVKLESGRGQVFLRNYILEVVAPTLHDKRELLRRERAALKTLTF